MLARIKLGPQEIRKAILAVDDARLSTDDLKAMSKQLPSQEEIARLKDFGDLSKLAKADQYFGEVRIISSQCTRLSLRRSCTSRGYPKGWTAYSTDKSWSSKLLRSSLIWTWFATQARS